MIEDEHFHHCEWCGAWFSHKKSGIAAGCGHVAHTCPACGKAVNERVEVADAPAAAFDLAVFDWYGGLRTGEGVVWRAE